MTAWRTRLRVAAVAGAAAVVLGSCSGPTAPGSGRDGHAEGSTVSRPEVLPGSEAATAAGAIQAMFAAYAAKDVPRWLGAWSDEGFAQAFGVPKSEAALVPPSWGNVRSFRDSVVTLRGISDERLGAQRGSLVAETGESGIVTWHRLDVVTVAGRWRVDGRTSIPVPAADGPPIDVTLADGSIRLSSPLAGGDLNLHATNHGTTAHELVLLRRRGGVDETVGRIAPLPPGSDWTLVARGLPRGDYSVVCNLLNAQGQPHSAAGMRAVLRVA